MAFPDGWAYRCSLDLAQANASLTDWTCLFTEANLPADIFTQALDGGGDIRFSLDQDGITQLPCHVRMFDKSGGRADIAVKVPTMSATGATRIWVWYLAAGETQPAVDDTYGQYNAYDDNYVLIWPLNEDPGPGGVGDIKDATSNQNHGTAQPALETADLVDAIAYKGIQFDNDTDYLVSTSTVLSTTATAECLFWINNVSDESLSQLAACLRLGAQIYQSELRSLYTWNSATGLTVTDQQWHYMTSTKEGSDEQVGLDGVFATPKSTANPGSGLIYVSTDYYNIGARGLHDGIIDELRVSNIKRADAWLQSNAANVRDPAGFTTVGTPETVIGGLTTTITATNAAGSDVQPFTWVEISPPG